jgi:microcystin-dependent protein
MGELRIMAFNFPPKGWAFCNGQTLPINQNQALFSLLGTMYGGDGQTTFALPNLQGSAPLHVGPGYSQGQRVGEYNHTLILAELPAHTHTAYGSPVNANQPTLTGGVLATALNVYAPPNNLTPLQPQTITNAGGSQPHSNTQPYLTLNVCIALQGIFPSRN